MKISYFSIFTVPRALGFIAAVLTAWLFPPVYIAVEANDTGDLLCVNIMGGEICGVLDDTENLSNEPGIIFDHQKTEPFERKRIALQYKISIGQISALARLSPLSKRWAELANHAFVQDANFLGLDDKANKALFKIAPFAACVIPSRNASLFTYRIGIDRIFSATINDSAIPKMCSSCSKQCVFSEMINPRVKEQFARNLREAPPEMFKTLRTAWAFKLYSADLANFREIHKPRVFVVRSNRRLSPSIDGLGNVYIPEWVISDLSPVELDVILVHEAAHIKAFQGENIKMAVYTAIKKGYFSTGSSDKRLSDIFASILPTSEIVIDLLALEYLQRNQSKRSLYSSVIRKMEGSSSKRVGLINRANKYIDRGYSIAGLRALLLMQQAIIRKSRSGFSNTLEMAAPPWPFGDNLNNPNVRQIYKVNDNEWQMIKEFINAFSVYSGEIQAKIMQKIGKSIGAMEISPWALDEHIQKAIRQGLSSQGQFQWKTDQRPKFN